MAKVLRSIMGRKEKSASLPAPTSSPELDESDARLQSEARNVNRRVSISRSGRYKQRDKRRSGIWDNPQLVHDQAAPADPGSPDSPGAPGAPGSPTAAAAPATPAASPAPPGNDKENSDAGSVRSKDSVRSRGSSVLLDTSQVAQELLDLAEQQLTSDAPARAVAVTNL